MANLGTTKTALLSDCGTYRSTLTRTWDDRPMLLVVMFNPSAADHEVDLTQREQRTLERLQIKWAKKTITAEEKAHALALSNLEWLFRKLAEGPDVDIGAGQ